MRSLQSKNTTPFDSNHSAFFQRGNGKNFFSKSHKPFFNASSIQAKLTVNNPNDAYEKEADRMADKVVQRLSENQVVQRKPVVPGKEPFLQKPAITPLIQNKCDHCEQEEKVQKEKEKKVLADKLQKKPAFDDNTDPPNNTSSNVQLKCAECERGGKLQKRGKDEFSKTQLKPIFESEGRDAVLKRKSEKGQFVQTKANKEVQLKSKSEYGNDLRIGPQRNIPSIKQSVATTPSRGSIQNKCASCENEEKLQKKEEDVFENKFQKKSIFAGEDHNNDAENPIQKKCANCEKDEQVQKKATTKSVGTGVSLKTAGETKGSASSHSLQSQLASSKGSGNAIPKSVRAEMESAFGADFSSVRLHTGSNAAKMSEGLGAHAFTHGSDIYFNSGKYDDVTLSGKNLLAHELTHTLQQGATRQVRNSSPSIAKKSDNRIHCLTKDEVKDRGKAVYDLLDGWTSSQDSADILKKFDGLNQGDTNGVLNAAALYASKSVKEIYEWMKSDMVTSDWKALVKKLVTVRAEDIAVVIAGEIHSHLTGWWVSENDSKEILDYLQNATGDSLDDILKELETKSGKNEETTPLFLLDSINAVDAETLANHFFNSGGLKAFKYATYWYANKIFELLSGYTSVRDSTDILKNFERIKVKQFQIAVYSKLNDRGMVKWNEEVCCVLMDAMQKEDYDNLQKILPEQFPTYCLKRNFFKKGWDKLVTGFDYLEGWLEWGICGSVGILVGVFDAVVSLVSGIIDIGIGIKNIIGWLISKASGGRFARECEENVNNFFTSIGNALKAPGDLVKQMWEKAKKEASLIEGPFAECKEAIYWMRMVGNFAVNIILLIFAGYGAVKAAIEAIETIKQISSFGEFVAKIGKLPAAILRKLKSIPGSIASAGSKIVNTIRNVDEIISAVRSSIGAIKLATEDENFWLNLRKAAGNFASEKIQTEKEFWKKRREIWKGTTTAEEANINKSEQLIDSATSQAESNPTVAEQQSVEAESQAKASQKTVEETKTEVETGKENPLAGEKKLPSVFVEESCSLGSLICPKGIPKFVRDKVGPYPNPKLVPYPGGQLVLRGLIDEEYLALRKVTGKSLRKIYIDNPDIWTSEFRSAYTERMKKFPKGDPEKWWPVEGEKRWQPHHKRPLDFGGDNSAANLIPLEPSIHIDYTNWWNALKREISGYFSEAEWQKIIGGDRNKIFLPGDF